MLARLLLALLLAAFALPSAAPAACHDAAPAAHTMPMPTQPPEQRAATVHACIGCIPPSDWLTPPLASPALAPTAAPVAGVTVRLAGLAPPPTVPPPRRG